MNVVIDVPQQEQLPKSRDARALDNVGVWGI